MFFHYIERYIEWIVRPSLNLPKHATRDTFNPSHVISSFFRSLICLHNFEHHIE